MSKLKVAELFYSIQGEGRYMGVPSVFLRTFGCNFKCEGFGMPKGEKTVEYLKIDPTAYEHYEDLPLVSTGCDSYASWDPRFKDLSPLMETDGIADHIMDILPYKQWAMEHLVITGGEPLLGWQRAYPDLLNHDKMKNLREITFETNGTQTLTTDFKKYLKSWQLDGPGFLREVTFSISAKLSNSGELREDAIKPEIVVDYQDTGYAYLKFVIATEEDAEEALAVTQIYQAAGFKGPVYLMPTGGTTDTYFMNSQRIAELAMANGLRYSARLQVDLFRNAWGT
jgi:organic radical activating enzyme